MDEVSGQAISIVPPFECWLATALRRLARCSTRLCHREPIEAIRRVHDKSVARWDPHTNLFFPTPVYGDVKDKLEAALATVDAFEARREGRLFESFSTAHRWSWITFTTTRARDMSS